ncbi:MAG: large ribosomal subunit protein bL35 [Opitutales bacterium]
MIKTRKSIRKRFKVTAKGKLKHRVSGHRHLLRNKTNKQKRRATQGQILSSTHTKTLRNAITPSL